MKQTAVGRKPYTGLKKAIVIALDVGTTFSGASYALLNPGEVPKIYEVTSFPGQEHQAGNPKIPSVIWYDRHGDPVKAGAEAEEPSNINTAEEQGWIKVELFKLRLRPKSMKLDMNGMKLPHLPKSKSAVEVFGDFLKYLLRCTRSFIVETHASGHSVWSAVENDIEFVLTHPNGWEGAQQSKMRKAAIYGGLVPSTDEGKAKVRFVTEGEASLHACVLNGLTDDVLANPSQHGFVVADAGGGTLDISSYAIKGSSPLLIEEIAPPDCLFSGSVFVSRRARKFLEQKLNGSQYGTPAMLDHITKRFDETTKRLFRGRDENQYLHFGSPLDKDLSVGIRNGKLKLTGDEVADLFEPSIEAAVDSIKNQIVLSGGMVKSVWLVGGFASSPCLFTQLQERLAPDGIVVSRPDGQTSKAVANGAISFYCDHHVGARIAKYMYGVEFLREFDPNDPEHKERQSRLFQLPSGPKLLPDAFDCILARNSRVKESTTFSRKYCTELTSLSTLSVFEIEVWCCRGPGEQPKWILRGQDDFSTLCFVRADLSPLTASAKVMTGPGGKKYWTIVFSIEIHFGLTEFKARIKWNHDGKTKYGPASIVYDEGGNKELEDDRDSQDEISALPTSRYVSRAPSTAPSRTQSMSNTPQTLRSPVEENSTVGTLVGTPMSRVLSASQPLDDRHPEGYAESSVSKKPKGSGSRSHQRSTSQQLSPNPSTVSQHTSRSERSQHSAQPSQHPSQRSASPKETPRDIPRLSPSPRPRDLSFPPVPQPVSREPSQLGQQMFIPPAITEPTPEPTPDLDREIPKSGHHTPNYYASTPTQSHISQPQQPSPLHSVLSDTTPGISRSHGRSKSIVTATEPPEPTGVQFPSVSTVGSPYETPVPRSARDSRTTSLTPSDSASNIHSNYLNTAPGSVAGSPLPESTASKKSKKDKNRSLLSTISSVASHSTTKPPTEQLQPPEPAPPVPQISIPGSPSVSTSLGGSRLTTNPNTPLTTRSLKPSFTSSLSYLTDRPEQSAPPQPPAMSRQNSDSVIAGGLGSSLGGVLNGIWGTHRSAEVSPAVENPPPGPATAAFESTLETIHDVEVPGGFGGEREWGAPAPAQEVIPEPVIVPPSPPKPEEPEPVKVPTPNAEIVNFPAPEPAEAVPQTPNEPEQSVLSVADRKKLKKQREKERKDKEAQEKREREEREAQEMKEREEMKQQEKAERDARKRKEREERERVEQERIAREAQEQAEREAKEQADREAEKQARRDAKKQKQAELEAREQADREARERAEREAWEQAEREAREKAEREAREQAEREAKERAERIERAEREAREAQERAEKEAREQVVNAAREKMDKVSRRRAEKEAAKQEAEEKARREAKERADEAARVKAERDAKRKAEKEAKEQAVREAREKAEQEEREKAEREAREKEEKERLKTEKRRRREEEERIEKERIENERIEWENKEAEREAREKAERDAREREEEEKKKPFGSKIPSAWGSTVGKNGDRSRKTSSISQKEQKNEWGGSWGFGSTEKKEESSRLPPIITSSVPGGIFEGAGHLDFFANKDSPGGGGGGGGSEDVELRTPLTKKGKDAIRTPSNLSKAATPTENADLGNLDMFGDMGLNNMSARVSVSSENERFTDAEQGPSPTATVQPAFAPDFTLEAFPNSTSELLKTPQAAKEEVEMAPKSWPPPPSNPPPPQASTPAPAPTKPEPEKPLSLWERKKLKTATSPPPASSLFGGGDAANSPEAWGDAGGGKNVETIAMPTFTGAGDRQSTFTDTARDQKRENQRENLVEGFLGSNPARRRNDSAQSQMPAKPAPKLAPAPVPQQKSSGWGSWGSSLLNTVASAVNPERTPSPEPHPVKPKIEDPPRGFTPNQPPKSQPAGFGTLNKPAPAWGGAGDGALGGAKSGPPPIAQKTSAGPAWGAKPNSGFGSGATTWGNPTGPTFGSAVSKNLTVDTAKKPLESGPNTPGPENIPESAVEIKHVPAPGGFGSSIFDKKEDVAEIQDGWGFEEAGEDKGLKKNSKEASPVREKAPEEPVPANETEEPAKTEEAATPAEEDEFDWAPAGKKKKKGQVASVSQTPGSVPNTPDPDNADDAANGGGLGKKKKKKGRK